MNWNNESLVPVMVRGDGELPDVLVKAIEDFNAKVVAYPHALSWVPTNKRIEFKDKNI